MDSREAITALTKAGKRKEVEAMLSKAVDRAAQSYQPIEQDEQLSDKGRKQRLAVTYLQHKRGIDTELQKMAAGVVNTDRDDASRVFGISGLPGDPASLSISRRDAGDRVASIDTAKELGELLRRANRSGDEVLARACAERATQMQGPAAAEVMNEFLNARPSLDAAGERLWNAERAVADSFNTTLILSGLRPTELQGMATYQIEDLAQHQPEPEPKPQVFAQSSLLGGSEARALGDYWGDTE
jgi:hypothetical protein